jgi:hypothetical protein
MGACQAKDRHANFEELEASSQVAIMIVIIKINVAVLLLLLLILILELAARLREPRLGRWRLRWAAAWVLAMAPGWGPW